jgi:hypothetical protein
MRTDHRRPLAAYGLVALVCALVMWQPSIGANVASRAPVVSALIDIGLSPSDLLSRLVVGDLFSLSPVAAPEEELPVAEPDLADDLLTPSQSVVAEAGGGSASAVAHEAGLTGANGGDAPLPGGDPTPGVDPEPDDDGKPGTGAPQGSKSAVPGHPGKGPKDKGDDHPGQGPKDKGDDHPGQGPKEKGDDHPGKGHQDKHKHKDKNKDKGPKDKGPKDKGAKGGSHGRGPKG